ICWMCSCKARHNPTVSQAATLQRGRVCGSVSRRDTMSESPHTCHVCSHAYQTRDSEHRLRPSCCPRCLAPRRRRLVPTPTAIEAWLLGLYGHVASVEGHGFLEHVLRTQARSEEAVHAIVN